MTGVVEYSNLPLLSWSLDISHMVFQYDAGYSEATDLLGTLGK